MLLLLPCGNSLSEFIQLLENIIYRLKITHITPFLPCKRMVSLEAAFIFHSVSEWIAISEFSMVEPTCNESNNSELNSQLIHKHTNAVASSHNNQLPRNA